MATTLDRTSAKLTADRATQLRAKGRDVLELFGAPYWLPPAHVLEAAAAAVGDPQSAHSQGMPALREAIAERLERDNGIAADPGREVLVTNAAMHALNLAFAALLDPGDEVVLFAPAFYFYGAIQLAGGVPVYAPTRPENGWAWDVAALEAAITPRTRLLVVNTPTNPTGYVATQTDLEAVAAVAQRHGLLVISDEAYDRMVYDGKRHFSLASLQGMRERTLTICSFTKSYAMKQWRVGFAAGPAAVIAAMRMLLEWQVLNCGHVAQHAALAALRGPQAWVDQIGQRLQHCRNLMVETLRGAPGLSFVTPAGAPFLLLDASALGLDGAAFSRYLLERYGVPTDPGAAFQAPSAVRLSFGGEDGVVRDAGQRIRAACQALAAGARGA